MDWVRQLTQRLQRWQARRRAREAARLGPDPADCGTAWGLELTQPPLVRGPQPKSRFSTDR